MKIDTCKSLDGLGGQDSVAGMFLYVLPTSLLGHYL